MTVTSQRKEREWKLREDLILDTAAAMFLQQGYLNLNLDRLAEKVEYSKGTLYQHFQTKEDLLLAAAARSMEQRQILFQRAGSFHGRPRERMAAVGIADLIFVHNHPQHFQIEQLMRTVSLWEKTSAERRQQFGLRSERCASVSAQIIQDAVAAGDLQLKDTTPQTIFFGVWTMSLGAHTLRAPAGLLTEMGLENPLAALRRNHHAYLDGLDWKPLFHQWDYAAVDQRIFSEIFTDYSPKDIRG